MLSSLGLGGGSPGREPPKLYTPPPPPERQKKFKLGLVRRGRLSGGGWEGSPGREPPNSAAAKKQTKKIQTRQEGSRPQEASEPGGRNLDGWWAAGGKQKKTNSPGGRSRDGWRATGRGQKKKNSSGRASWEGGVGRVGGPQVCFTREKSAGGAARAEVEFSFPRLERGGGGGGRERPEGERIRVAGSEQEGSPAKNKFPMAGGRQLRAGL
ncbi:unnamed protein product [Calypogeia fissa]